MITGIVSFFFGILLFQQWQNLPELIWCWGLILLLVLPFIPKRFACVLLLILGFLWALLRAHWVLDSRLPGELQGKDLLATGIISSIPVVNESRLSFVFDIEQLEYRQQKINSPGKVRLNWYIQKRNSEHVGKSKNFDIKAGQRWRLWIRLKQPHGFMNPGGFDFEGWLYQNKINATGYVRLKPEKGQYAKKLIDHASGYALLSLRQTLHDKIISSTAGMQSAGILVALALGERSAINQAQWQVFRATGTSHLVAISGLHIGLLAGLVYFLTLKLWPRLFPAAALMLASPRAAAISSLLAGLFYAGLSGFAIPAQRALLMLAIVMLYQYRLQKIQGRYVLGLALLGVLLLDPVAVLSPGFWLSFAAVAIISLTASGRLKYDNKWLQWGRIQWRISIALIPLLLYLFQQASLISPLANLIAIPVISFLVVPLIMLATLLVTVVTDFSVILYGLADHLLGMLWWLLAQLSSLSWSEWSMNKPDLAGLILASFGFALLLTPKGWPLKSLGAFMLLPLFFAKANSVPLNTAEVSLLDVGQGLAVVIQTRQHALLFDTGPKFSDEFDAGRAVVVPFLRQRGITKLDTVVLSHKDNDHRGGFSSIQKLIKVSRRLSSYGEPGSEACQAGQAWLWEGVLFEILNPELAFSDIKRNNNSCVLRVTANGESVLLTGDIEVRAEKHLLQTRQDKLGAKYLVVPHHGSKTSSSVAFLEAVNPQYALIPAGYLNRYHMPHSTVMQRYASKKIETLQTSTSGTISFLLGEKSSNQVLLEYRKQAQKYWNSRH